MSIPNITEKLKAKAIIEPTGVIEERRKIGLHPSTEIPEGAIICYDSSLWNWIGTLLTRVECDGWLKGSFLLPHRNSWILVSKAFGFVKIGPHFRIKYIKGNGGSVILSNGKEIMVSASKKSELLSYFQ